MYIYVTSTNMAGSSIYLTTVHPRLLYFGTSVKDAEACLGRFAENPSEKLPNEQTILEYSALPKDTKREMLSFYLRNDRWASIERFEIPWDECYEKCAAFANYEIERNEMEDG